MSQIPDSEQPALPSQPETLPKIGFSLSKRDWIVYMGGVVVVLLTVPFQKAASYPLERLIPYVGGLIAGLSIISGVPSLLVFYFSGRSRSAASRTFMLLVVLVSLGQIGEIIRNGGKARDDEAAIRRMAPAFQAWMTAQTEPYRQACDDAVDKSPVYPSWVKERADLAIARERVKRFRSASDKLRGLYDRIFPVVHKELAAQGLPEGDCSRLAMGVCNPFNNTKSLFATLRDQDEATTTEYLKVCDLLDKHWGHWHCDANTGEVVFESDDVANEFNAILAKLQKLGQEQERNRAELTRALQQGGK